MAAKHCYQIMINGGADAAEPAWKYSFGSVKNVLLYVSDQKATIAVLLGKILTIEDIISFKSKVFRDAYRKVYLVHAFDRRIGLIPKQIDIYIDDQKYSFNDSYPGFPFLFSMINGKLDLDDSWKDMIPAVVRMPKHKMDDDLRMSAVFSFLAAQGRKYSIDRFVNLWTSMNAYYSYLNTCYEHYFKNNYTITEEELNKLKISSEADLLGSAVWQLSEKYRKLTKSEADELWKSNYDVERYLSGLTIEQINDLYSDSLQFLDSQEAERKYELLTERAETFGLSLFTFLLLEYPYHYRCNYFHGNRSTLVLLAYNDYEYYVLKVINYFLETYLKTEIPKMFSEDFWTLEKQNKMEHYIASIKEDKPKRKYLETLETVKHHPKRNDPDRKDP